jgi:hypothetical protein
VGVFFMLVLVIPIVFETVASQQNRLVVKAFFKRSYVTVMSLRITRLINAAMHRWVNACEKILSLLSPYHVDSRLSATLLQSLVFTILIRDWNR